jgi:hypothetical protein
MMVILAPHAVALYLLKSQIPNFMATAHAKPLFLTMAFTATYEAARATVTLLLGFTNISEKAYIRAGCICSIGFAFPFYLLVANDSPMLLLLFAAILFGAVGSFFDISFPMLMLKLFPTPIRASAVGLSLNTPMSFLGGTAPVIATALVALSSTVWIPSLYIMLWAAIALIVSKQVRFFHDTRVLHDKPQTAQSLV